MWFSNFRRLWKNVTDSLRDSEIDKATEHKRTLEERQRTEERHRTETGTPWKTKYFIKDLKLVPLPLALTLLLEIFLSLGTSILIPVSAIVSTLFAYYMFKKEIKMKQQI